MNIFTSAFPFLISEINEGKVLPDDENYIKIHNYYVSNVYTYGFVLRKNKGEQNTDGEWIKTPTIILTDEMNENEILVSPRPWKKNDIEIIQSLNENSFVIVKGKLNKYKKDDKERIAINIDYIMNIPITNISSMRDLFLMKLFNIRIYDTFKKNTYLYQFLKANNIPLTETENEFTYSSTETNTNEIISSIQKKIEEPKVKDIKSKIPETPSISVLDNTNKSENIKTVHSDHSNMRSVSNLNNTKKTEIENKQITINNQSSIIEEKIMSILNENKNKKLPITGIKKEMNISMEEIWKYLLIIKRKNNMNLKIETERDETYITYKL